MITETQNPEERRTLELWPDVGRMLGLSRPSTYAAAKNGQIPTIRIGGRILVPRAALERLLDGAS
jgi:excisionase family DNA binding protein